MNPKVNVPGPSASETELQRQQAELLAFQRQLLESQQRQQQALLPFFASQLGLELSFDPNTGEVTGARQVEDEQQTLRDALELETLQRQLEFFRSETGEDSAELRAKQREIEERLADRSLAALEGTLPVDPALERELAQQEETLRERLAAQLGPGFETSTPGIEAMRQFEESAAVLRSGARRGELTLAEQLGLARSQDALSREQFRQSQLSVPLSLAELGLGTGAQQFNQFQAAAFGLPSNFIQQGGSVAAGFGQAQNPFIQQRQLQLQGNLANAQLQSSFMGGVGQLAGTLFGALPIFSSEHVKELPLMAANARVHGPITDLRPFVDGLPIYVFRYLDGEERIGYIAEELMIQRPELIEMVMGIPAIHYEAL